MAKKVKIEEENRSYLLSDSMNFNEVFRKNVTYDNIKSHKNQGFTLRTSPSSQPF